MIIGATVALLLAQAAATTPAARPESQPITKARVQEQIKAGFARLDANKDGWVDTAEATKARDEAVAALEQRRKERLDAVFARLDANKDGSLSRQEFDASIRKVTTPPNVPWLDSYDANNDGRVSLEEAMAKAVADFDQIDRDKNGVISAQEARAARQQTSAARNTQQQGR